MEIQKSQKTLEKNQKKTKKNKKIIKKKSNPWLFPENPKNPGFDSFLMFFDYFLILFGGNHGNPKIAKNPRKKSKKIKKNQILGCFLKILKVAKNPGFDSFLIIY